MNELFINVVKTKSLVVEYFPLPVTTTSFDFLYRFVAPVETVWLSGSINREMKNTETGVNNWFMDKFKEIFKGSDHIVNMVRGIEIYKCKMVREKDENK